MKSCWSLFALILGCLNVVADAQTREEKVRDDRQRVVAEGFWIYNDLPRAFAQAKSTGKPIVVTLRCIPCEECVKLDDDLVDTDPTIRPLLEQFVCVRVVSTNGLDLSLFQYDTDQSFAMFMLNADRTIYGRFGTRSHRTEWVGDVSLKGLAKALQGALDLHKDFDNIKGRLVGKTGPALEYSSPEKYPSLKDKFTDRLQYEGDVVKSCIHCHQIGDARRDIYRSQKQPIPAKLLFPFPHPKSVGLIMDPNGRATIKEVVADSLASSAGFKTGDRIESLNEQPLLSIADVQWVLDAADPSGDVLTAQVRATDDSLRKIEWRLPAGWRQADDIAWRVSSWGYRRMVTGGMKLAVLSAEERTKAKISEGKMALRVTHVGKYGPHAVAKRAGVTEDDILTGFAGQADLMTPSQLLAWGVTHTTPQQMVDVELLRNGKVITKKILMQQ